MSYHGPHIAAQLRKTNRIGLKIIAARWADSLQMAWLVAREQAFRLLWPDEQDTSERRQKACEALLTCERTSADRCERGLALLECQDCPYVFGEFAGDEPHPLPWARYGGKHEQEFYDVRARNGRVYRWCWPYEGFFKTETGEEIKYCDVLRTRLTFPETATNKANPL